MSENQTIVIDNGSGYIQAGFAGDDAPMLEVPALIGRDAQGTVTAIGHEAEQSYGSLNITCPAEHGIITDWDDMVMLWGYTFDKLGVDPAEHPVLITEKPLNPKANRERTMQLMFEHFNIPAFYIATEAVLSLYASGRTTGITLHSGDGVTHTVPVYEGYALPHAVIRMDLAGRDVTDHLTQLINKNGHAICGDKQRDDVQAIKEQHCYIAVDFEAEETKGATPQTVPFEGTHITLANELFTAPEVLFRPELIGMDSAGVAETLYNSVMKCDVDIRKDLYANIVLCGFNTAFPGFAERVQQEVAKLAPPTMKIKIIAAPERKYSSWIGGSILASLSFFPQELISYDEYERYGASVVHRKQF